MFKTSKRSMAIILAALMTASAFGGCSQSSTASSSSQAGSSATPAGGAASSAAPASSAAAGETNLIFYCNPQTNGTYTETVNEFQKENPNIKVQIIETSTNTSQRAQQLSTVLQAKDPNMDVFFIDCTWPSTYYAAGWVEPLNDVFTEEELNQYLPGPIEANTVDGTLCSVPLYIDAGILMYRKDMLEKYNFQPPKTWDELSEQAKTIMAKEPSITSGYSGAWKQAECMVCCANEILKGYGGGVLDENGKVILDTPESAAGLQKMHDMIFVDKITDAGITSYIENDARVPFFSGNALFLRDWPSGYSQALDPEKSQVVDKVDFAPVPAGSKSQVVTLGGWSLAVSPFSEHKVEAKKFLKYMTSSVSATREAITNARLPALKSVYEDKTVLEKRPTFTKLQECTANVSGRPKTAYYEELSGVLQQGFASVLADTATVDEALKSMAPQIEEIMKR